MKRNKYLSIIIAVLLSTFFFSAVFAGSTVDFGQLVGIPPVGTVNFYAWDISQNLTGGIPKKIITEDSYLSYQGPDRGYFNNTNANLGPLGPSWRLIVPNLTDDYSNTARSISMVFGGLPDGGTNLQRGKIWTYNFNYTMDPSIKNWGVVGTLSENRPYCPTIYPVIVNESSRVVTFNAQAGVEYQIYRSQNGTTSNNGLSNGIYYWIGSTTTLSNGVGTYFDTNFDPTAAGWWYEIIQIDPTGVNGCHSEPIGPTAVEVADFTAVYDLEVGAVKFSWQTFSESNLVGFNIYRSDSENGLQVPVNNTLIPASKPGSIEGALYNSTLDPSLWDTEVVKGQVYYYWLEAIRVEGSPIILSTVFTPPLTFHMFMPLINH